MKNKSITFNHNSEVAAVLNGFKTQTRRIYSRTFKSEIVGTTNNGKPWPKIPRSQADTAPTVFRSSPLGVSGERLWVKEAFDVTEEVDGVHYVRYSTDQETRRVVDGCLSGPVKMEDGYHWERGTSLYMPRRLSRITLEICDVNFERLQDISEDDAQAEVVDKLSILHGRTAIEQFSKEWDLWNKKLPWDANPWVWAIKFKRVA